MHIFVQFINETWLLCYFLRCFLLNKLHIVKHAVIIP